MPRYPGFPSQSGLQSPKRKAVGKGNSGHTYVLTKVMPLPGRRLNLTLLTALLRAGVIDLDHQLGSWTLGSEA